MNVYIIAITENGKAVVLSSRPTLMVHGAENCEIALNMLRSGKQIEEILPLFCANCGNLKPCKCSLGFRPQGR